MTTRARQEHVLYVLGGYPVLSETFVLNEIAGLRAGGTRVSVLAMKPGQPDSVDPAASGRYVVAGAPDLLTAGRAWTWWLTRHPWRCVKLVQRLISLRGSVGRFVALQLPQALRAAVEEPVDAVHVHFAWQASSMALYVGALLDAPVSVTVHADDLYLPSRDLAEKLALMDRVVTVCQFNADLIGERGYAISDLRIVPCGVDVPDEEPAPVRGADVLSVGRLVRKKGYPDLLDAFAVVARRRPDATLEIIGDGPLRSQLEDQIVALGLQDRVTLRGAAPHAEVLRRLAECTVFTLASRVDPWGSSDALPVAIREAMARGRPVVATDVAGIPETLDGVGWVTPTGDAQALAGALLEVIDDPAVAEQRGLAGRDRTLAHYTLDHTVQGMRTTLGLTTQTEA
jgi:colanic acid/amylovoran biosynthesis glycosyltransferase